MYAIVLVGGGKLGKTLESELVEGKKKKGGQKWKEKRLQNKRSKRENHEKQIIVETNKQKQK
jgi:pyrroline-5-carboxylate reductase